MTDRKPLSRRTRFDVFKRNGFKCQYCGRVPPQVVLEVDHIVSVSKGGTDHQTNLVTACFDCNRGKTNGDLQSVPASVADQIQRHRELAAQTRAYHRHVEQIRKQEDETIETLGRYWYNQLATKKDRYTWGEDRKRSGRLFLKWLSLENIYEGIDIAFARKPAYSVDRDEGTWKYFCGVCWRKIKEAAPHG